MTWSEEPWEKGIQERANNSGLSSVQFFVKSWPSWLLIEGSSHIHKLSALLSDTGVLLTGLVPHGYGRLSRLDICSFFFFSHAVHAMTAPTVVQARILFAYHSKDSQAGHLQNRQVFSAANVIRHSLR